MRIFVVLIVGLMVMSTSCQRGGHPCPTLSTSPSESKNALIKKSVPTTKNGLVKKKGVKKVKRR